MNLLRVVRNSQHPTVILDLIQNQQTRCVSTIEHTDTKLAIIIDSRRRTWFWIKFRM